MNKEKTFLSIVIYVHNAEGLIGNFLEELFAWLEDHFENSEIICVNDASSDNSVEEIREVSSKARSTTLTILNMSYFHGPEVAINAGLDLSIGDFVVEIERAFPDYSLDEMMKAYNSALEGYDIVSASPERKQRLSSTLFYWLYKRFSDDHTELRTESFCILSRRAINRVDAMSNSVPYRKALYASCGLKTKNIRYQPINETGKNKKDHKINRYKRSLAVDSLVMFTNAGYSLTKALTIIMMIFSVFMIVYTVIVYASAHPVEGWTTTILFLALAFCVLFAILTVITKYLQILLNLTFRRKKYSYESIEKLTK